MSPTEHVFLFASLDCKQPISARKVHLRRLYDILQLSIHRQDFERAKRVWAILVRCKEVDWKGLWPVGLHILGAHESGSGNPDISVEYLRTIMLQYPDDRESILKELVFRLLLKGKCREALDELELYLPSFPYQNNPVFHIYAGLTSLYLAQLNTASRNNAYDPILLRDAQTHFDHAILLDEKNVAAQAFLDKITALQTERHTQDESDDESMVMDDDPPDKKRTRTGIPTTELQWKYATST